MEEIVDGNTLETLAVRYSEEERAALLVAIRVFREELLQDDHSYEDLEGLQGVIETTFTIEDALETTTMFKKQTDAYVKQYYLSALLRTVKDRTRVEQETLCATLGITYQQLHECGATAIVLADTDALPDILLIPGEQGGSTLIPV